MRNASMSNCGSPNSQKSIISDTVENELEGRILRGVWKAGFKLPSESALCKEFAVSRTAIREALKNLRGRGVINTRKGSGSYVADAGIEMISRAINTYSDMSTGLKSSKDLVGFREMIEGAALYRLAQKSSQNLQVVSELESIIEKMKSASSTEIFYKQDTAFHVAIMKSCDNALVSMIADALYGKYLESRNSPTQDISPAMRDATIGEHTMIINALRDRNAAQAVSALEQHLKEAEERGSVLGEE